MTGREILIDIGQTVLPKGRTGPDDIGFHLNTPELLNVYQKVYYYLSDHNKSITNGINPSKSLLFCGNAGPGKTVCMKVMQQMALRVDGLSDREMIIVPVSRFLKIYKQSNSEAFSAYGFDKKIELCIDELGWEVTEGKIYSTDACVVIANWILERYELFVQTGIRTHFTTNYPFFHETEHCINRMYGPRIQDRLKEMSNVINWVGGSLRK